MRLIMAWHFAIVFFIQDKYVIVYHEGKVKQPFFFSEINTVTGLQCEQTGTQSVILTVLIILIQT